MTDATFHPGYKFQGHCMKNCKNRGIKCRECFRIHGKETEFIENENEKDKTN